MNRAAFEKSTSKNADLLRRHFRDRLQDSAGNLVRVAFRVWTTIFQIALEAGLGEAVWHAHRRTAVGYAVAELVPWSGFVFAGQTLVVVRAVDGNVCVQV